MIESTAGIMIVSASHQSESLIPCSCHRSFGVGRGVGKMKSNQRGS